MTASKSGASTLTIARVCANVRLEERKTQLLEIIGLFRALFLHFRPCFLKTFC
jgi:hypothetical protein